MFNIFEEKPQPCLYIADIIINVAIPTRSKKKKEFDRRIIKLEKYPIILLDGKMPSNKYATKFFKSIYEKYISRGSFETIRFEVKSMTNIKFSSKLNYMFDYSEH
jgi:hypothetical protein